MRHRTFQEIGQYNRKKQITEKSAQRMMMYQLADEDVVVNAVVAGESFGLTQKTMAEPFGVQVVAIG